ncbi:hypothetical protein I350_00626 [Cryptococcus amylolentus CBS 6273]|uniref:Uncharacterized protein n=1 Tax=Cryptococcus amylolentus CBS 6273 TaxID=1296118 RepID=A0A1E3KHP8_9TREE|nr:hypothetical protein I350_00626 [Cryptococcus amylolentus CBS 6273]
MSIIFGRSPGLSGPLTAHRCKSHAVLAPWELMHPPPAASSTEVMPRKTYHTTGKPDQKA